MAIADELQKEGGHQRCINHDCLFKVDNLGELDNVYKRKVKKGAHCNPILTS
jgi:hypothetical protein